MSHASDRLLRRRRFLQMAGAVVPALGVAQAAYGAAPQAGAAVASGQKSGRRPNIIFILADDLGIGDVGVYGQQKIRTPHIDSIGQNGKRFTQAYCGAPVCSPSRCSFLTGLHQGHARVRGNFVEQGGTLGSKNGVPVRRVNLTAEDVTIADHLRDLGYRTGLFGKWHLDGYEPEAIPNNHGFDEFRGWLIQDGTSHGYFPQARYHDRERVEINPPGTAFPHYETDLVTADASDFIRRNAQSPFFLFASYSAPHSPYGSPSLGSYGGRPWSHDQKSYAALIEHLDQGVGEILRTLEEAGLSDDTLIILTSDNGALSEPEPRQIDVVRFFGSNGGLRGYKRDLYDGGIHVPLLAQWPGQIPKGSVSEEPIYFPDFLPSFVALAGGREKPLGDGVDITPLLTGKAARLPQRFLYWETFEPEFRQAVRWGDWKAVRLSRTGPLELYNLKDDPAETSNIAGKAPDIIRQIETYLKTARKSTREFP